MATREGWGHAKGVDDLGRADARPEDSPIAWFGELLLAIDRRDFSKASRAHRNLARLGFMVEHVEPRTPRGQGAMAR